MRLRLSVALLAVVIGGLYGLPHILWLHDIGWDYNNAIFVTSFQTVDSYHYIGQIKEISEGNSLLSNTYLAEYKNTEKSPWPVFPFYVYATLGRILHLNIEHLMVLMDVVLPPIVFVLSFLLLMTLGAPKRGAILGAFLLTLAPHLLKLIVLAPLSLGVLMGNSTFPVLSDVHGYYGLSRPVNPQLTFPLLLMSLLCFFKAFTTSKRQYFVFSIIFGISVSYSYVYFSTYLYAVLGIGACISLCFREYKLFKTCSVVLGSIVICSIPFWYSVLHVSDTKLHQMAEMVKSHVPLINSQIAFTLVLSILVLLSILKGIISKFTGTVSMSLLLGGILCMNQQILTGIDVQPWHYEVLVLPQFTLLTLVIYVSELLRHYSTKQLPVTPIMFYGGILIGGFSVAVQPSFVASHLSIDGSLTPNFTRLLATVHHYGMLLGGFIVLSVLIKTHLPLSKKSAGKGSRKPLSYISRLFRRYVRLSSLLYIAIIMYVIADIAGIQYQRYTRKIQPQLGYLQQLRSGLHWLDTHTERESVVLGSVNYASTSSIIPIYTHNNVYVEQYAQYYTVPPMSEIMDRLYNLMLFSGVKSREDFRRFVEAETSHRPFGGRFQPDFEEYQKKLGRNVYHELTTYRADYLFYGPNERKIFRVPPDEMYNFLEKQYDDGFVAIYKIK